MKNFNLTEWALQHRPFIGFFMMLLLLGGIFAYFRLGQHEDPDFTFRAMVVKTIYPGATAQEVELQVTDRSEKKLQELPKVTRKNNLHLSSLSLRLDSHIVFWQ